MPSSRRFIPRIVIGCVVFASLAAFLILSDAGRRHLAGLDADSLLEAAFVGWSVAGVAGSLLLITAGWRGGIRGEGLLPVPGDILPDSESQIALAMELAELGTWRYDFLADRMCLDARCQQHFRCERAELKLAEAMAAMHPGDRRRLEEGMASAFAAGRERSPAVVVRLLAPTGDVHYIQTFAQIRYASQGGWLRPVSAFGTSQDITARKIAELALRRSEAKHRALFETMNQGVVYQQADGRIVDANPAAERILGIGLVQMRERASTGQPWGGLREHGRLLPAEAYPAMQALARGTAVRNSIMELDNLQEAAMRWVDIAAVPLFLPGEKKPYLAYTIFDDITHQKAVEEALRDSHQELQRAQAIGQSGSWRLDVISNCLKWSDETCSLFGAGTSPPATYEDFLAMVHPDDQARVVERWRAALQGTAGYDVEHRITVNGAVRWIRERAELEFDADGRLTGALGTAQDITQHKLAAGEIERAHAELQALAVRIQAIREEERKRIAREIHDELGQSLSALRMDASWVKGRLLPEQAELRNKADDMMHAIHDMVGIVRRIAQELRPSILDTLDIAAAIKWQAVEFRKRMGIRCNITVPDVAPDLPEAVRTHLFRICQELLTNVSRHAMATRVDVTLSVVGDVLLLTVADNGQGMLPGAVTDGVGLVGVRERLEQIGGVLDVVTVPRVQGTRVSIRIPLAINLGGKPS